MAYKGINYDPMLRWAYYVGIAVIGILFIVLRPMRAPPPPNSAAFGCYATNSAPPILLNSKGMIIRQRGFPLIGYHLERHKTGIALTADAPIEANATEDQYIYSIRQPGEGWFLDFYREIDGHRYGVFDESDLSRFTMLARDGNYLAYEKASLSTCRPAAN